MTVADNIKHIRNKKGLTQKQLGEKSGISEAMIRQYELGIRNPKIQTIQKIATALEVPISNISEPIGFNISSNMLQLFAGEPKISFNQEPNPDILAAHLAIDSLTTEELEDVKQYIEFIKSKRFKKSRQKPSTTE